MSNIVLRSQAESLASLPAREQKKFLASLSEEEFTDLELRWSFWARPNQLAPDGDWLVWLILAGRGFGKTRSGAEWVRSIMCGSTPLGRGLCRHVALVGQSAADVRKVMVGDGLSADEASGILQVHPKDFRPDYNPSKKRLTWPNGAVASLFNATEPEELRGPQFDAAWCDELAKWRYAQATWDMLMFGLRLGLARCCVTTTPKPIQLLKELVIEQDTAITRGTTYENRANLAPKFLEKVVKKYEGTRLGRQELNAELLDDVPGALWSRAGIEKTRVVKAPALARIVVAIDPSGTAGVEPGEESDGVSDIGVVAVGIGLDGHLYVLEDATTDEGPAGWGAKAVEVYHRLGADRIVAERNFGGAMVEHVIRTADANVPVKLVSASRGKWVRAEPASALYEQGRVHHVGAFPDLEDEMCAFGLDGKANGRSPNRMDALVWAVTELALSGEQTIFSAAESAFLCDPIRLPGHWGRACAFVPADKAQPAVALWAAFDSSAGTMYLCDSFELPGGSLATFAEAVHKRGRWVPVLTDELAASPDLEERLIDLNVDLYMVEDDIEAGIADVTTKLSTGSIRAFRNLGPFIAQFRRYRRDEKGAPMVADAPLMKAFGLLARFGSQIAAVEHSAAGDDDLDDSAASGRSATTGY